MTRRSGANDNRETGGPSGPSVLIEYLSAIPEPREIPAGKIVVHNRVKPARKLGTRGFRAYLAAPDERFEPCDCEWASELGQPYIPKSSRS